MRDIEASCPRGTRPRPSRSRRSRAPPARPPRPTRSARRKVASGLSVPKTAFMSRRKSGRFQSVEIVLTQRLLPQPEIPIRRMPLRDRDAGVERFLARRAPGASASQSSGRRSRRRRRARSAEARTRARPPCATSAPSRRGPRRKAASSKAWRVRERSWRRGARSRRPSAPACASASRRIGRLVDRRRRAAAAGGPRGCWAISAVVGQLVLDDVDLLLRVLGDRQARRDEQDVPAPVLERRGRGRAAAARSPAARRRAVGKSFSR